MGDVAARFSPAGGLGLNTGLHSVAKLAWKPAAVVHGQAGDGLLDTYGRERLGIVRDIFERCEDNTDEIVAIVDAATSGDCETARAKTECVNLFPTVSPRIANECCRC